MQQTTLQYLSDIVASQGVSVFPTRKGKHSSSLLKKAPQALELQEVYLALGGIGNCWEIEFSLPEGIETDQVRLSLDGPLHFNRYRAITLNSQVYEKEAPGWLDSYRRNCRQLERECLKDGLRRGVWTNPEAEKHFGQAQEVGDFFGAGSPGWKLEAYRQFLADVYLFENRQKHKRISLFERLMIQGSLLPLQQLLISRSESNQRYLIKFLSRQLELPVQEKNS